MKGKKLGLVLALVLSASVFVPFAACGRGDKISDSARAEMSEIAETAQFMPNAQTVMRESAETVRSMKTSLANEENVADGENAFDVFDMEKLLSELAVIGGNGAGKYLGYEVDEIKTEMYNMVNRAPWMNEWFRVPRAKDGVDYFSDWAYLIENDLEYNFLSITRISWRTRASYYDSERGVEVEDYEGGSAVQYNVMRTKYYMDEGTEIVEVEMLDVMQAHGNDYFMAYQGLKNAEDKYFIKYNIEANPRTLLGYTLDTETPYGANRSFSYMTYENSNFDLLQITQRYPNPYRTEYFRQYPAGGSLEMISRRNGNFDGYSLSYDYGEDGVTPINAEAKGESVDKAVSLTGEMSSRLGLPVAQSAETENEVPLETETERILGELSKKLVDEHELAGEWKDIFKDSDKAKEEILDEIALPIKIKYHFSEVHGSKRGGLGDVAHCGEISLFTYESKGYLVPNPVFRNMTECNYYLAPALMNGKGEILYFPNDGKGAYNDYDPAYDIMWYGEWLETERQRGKNALTPNDFTGFTEYGEYALVTILREKGKDGHLENICLCECSSTVQGFSFTNGETAYQFYQKGNQLRLRIGKNTGEFEKTVF